ncbi:hypothetical protein [Oceanobacillus bengalensis]|uniref:DUF8042 domain-containing protein n=1 Tax=Oceanobacillus bengalensis TaxID=1435466 RepID=A0A494Z6I8_9BACI|nr:hypothetical protein [Oceanobacillus bengalensis]RKQ18182.1 hypothetical protein D8M05_01910 [Oceanobacillus bengalensis]
MEKNTEVMQQSKELLQTVNEALQHIQNLLKEGKFESTITLFGDVVQAYSAVEGAVDHLPDELLSVENRELTTEVRNAIELIVSAYESKDYGKVQEVLQLSLIPRFSKWQEDLESVFEQYLVS